MHLRQRLHLWADELRAIANEGLRWGAKDAYAQRRFQRIIRVAAEMVASQESSDADHLEQLYQADLSHQAPYPVGDAAIFNGAGAILLIQRKDNGLWAMPGGFFEVGETAAEGTCREALEETGLHVEPVTLCGVYDSRLCGTQSTAHLYQFVFLCRPRDEFVQPVVTEETLGVCWFAQDSLPPLDPGHAARIADAFECWRGQIPGAIFDPFTS